MSTQKFVVLVPVKPPSVGKTRLSGFTDEQRRGLAEAFARDTVAAALACDAVDRVLVVTDDFRFAALLRAEGCQVIPDGVTGDLNATLQQAGAEARRRWPAARPAVLCADLPSLRTEDLTAVLRRVAEQIPNAAFVPDLNGEGTSFYTAPHALFAPRFGLDSAAAHRALGAVALDDAPVSVRADVDDPDDLSRALRLGAGGHTTRLVAEMSLTPPPPRRH